MIRINCLWTTQLTRAMVPVLNQSIASRAADRACILNMSSAFAILPSPLFSVYAGTKAYDDAFAVALAAELKPYKIDVTSVLPGVVVSAMSKLSRSNMFAPPALDFAKVPLFHEKMRKTRVRFTPCRVVPWHVTRY